MGPRLSRLPIRTAAIVVLGTYVGWTVLLTPPMGAVVPWVWLGLLLSLGLTGIPGSGLLRSPAPLLLMLFWVVWAAMLPVTTAWAPGTRPVTREVMALASAAVVSVTLVLLSRGERAAVRAFEWLWLVVFLTTLVITGWEISTTEHLLVTRERIWEAPPRSPAATFINPNNYACVLVVVFGVATQWLSAPRVQRWLRVLLGLVSAGSVALVVLTASRAALLALAVQLTLALLLWLTRAGHVATARRWGARHRAAAAGLGVLAAAVVAATVLVPALAARNPVLRMLLPRDADTAASDGLRLALTRTGLRYWRQNPWTGTGAGSFESRLNRERPPGVVVLTNMHNAFVELLSQYGLVVTAPFALLLLLLCWRVVRRVNGSAHDPATAGTDQVAMRFQLAAVLVGVIVAGLTVSSALTWTMWWVMIAHATVLAWAVHRRPARAVQAPVEPNDHADERRPQRSHR